MAKSKILDLPALDFNGTKVLRKAKFVEMRWSDRDNPTYMLPEHKSLKVIWEVYPVDNEGNKISNPLFAPYEKTLLAVNSTMVDKTTGDYINMEPIANPDGSMTIPPKNPNAIGEYDYFVAIADGTKIIATDLIMKIGTRAVEMGKF